MQRTVKLGHVELGTRFGGAGQSRSSALEEIRKVDQPDGSAQAPETP
ncbi:MAG TPA: hypothetical protein VH142_23035 [Polyangiaceae bacterium]|nr:hypothetical protein [Polyangiaceae bacterium]